MGIAGGFTNYIQRSTLALGNLAHMVDVLLVDEKTHALLTLVGNDFLGRQCLVADRQLSHINLTTTFLNKLGETVDMTG